MLAALASLQAVQGFDVLQFQAGEVPAFSA
jgi:hypothetical protein